MYGSGGGPATVRQFLRAGLVDQMHLAIVPALFGRGERVFDDDVLTTDFECVEFVSSPVGRSRPIRPHLTPGEWIPPPADRVMRPFTRGGMGGEGTVPTAGGWYCNDSLRCRYCTAPVLILCLSLEDDRRPLFMHTPDLHGVPAVSIRNAHRSFGDPPVLTGVDFAVAPPADAVPWSARTEPASRPC